MMNWRLILIALTNLILSKPAHALWIELEPALLVNAAAPSQIQNGSNLSWTGKTAFSGGLMVSVNLGDTGLFIETGAVHMKELSERITPTSLLIRETNRLHLPLVVRYHFDDRFGLGIGTYLSLASGSVINTTDTATSLDSYSGAGMDEKDIGLLLSARASIPIISQFRFIIDGRYQHGLSGTTHHTRSMQAYLGISWLFSTES